MAARPTMGPQGGDPWAAAAARTAAMPSQAPLNASANAWIPGAGQANASYMREPPGMSQRPRVANELFPEMDPKDLNRIFDHKIAQDPDFKFDGEGNGGAWMKRMRTYLVSQCAEIAPILDFAESLDDEVLTLERLEGESNTYRWMTELNIGKLGHKLWGFLNTALTGTASDFYHPCGESNGFDGPLD